MDKKILISIINLLIVALALIVFEVEYWIIGFYLLGTGLGTFFGAEVEREAQKKVEDENLKEQKKLLKDGK